MSDLSLRQDILDELEFEPSIDAADIGVAVENGIVTLSGHVPTYAQKIAAEKAVLRVKGVKGIAEEIKVRPAGRHLTADDDEIAKRIVNLLKWNSSVPAEDIKVKVQNGWVTLMGKVDWHFQKSAAASVVQGLQGVTSVTNEIEIKPRVSAEDVTKRIEDAFKRDAELEARALKVQTQDGRVVLQGKVHTWHERQAAKRAAWSVAGVTAVEDNLSIS